MIDFVVSQNIIPFTQTLQVKYYSGRCKYFNAFLLGCEWFKMSNDYFYDKYGFNFNPHEFGLYERCRKAVYPNEEKYDT